METDNFCNFTTKIEKFTKNPDKYLSSQDAKAEDIKHLTEDLYNFTKQNEEKNQIPETLPKLVVDNLDEEQIWQQIELQNNSICNQLVSDIAHLLAKSEVTFSLKAEKKSKKKSDNDRTKNNNVSSEKSVSNSKIKMKKVKPSIVDDKFFKLYEMEEFLEKVERGEEKDEEEIDYFQDDDEADDEQQLHYNDFFDEPDGEFEQEYKNKKVKFDVGNHEEGEANDSNENQSLEDEEDDEDDDEDEINEDLEGEDEDEINLNDEFENEDFEDEEDISFKENVDEHNEGEKDNENYDDESNKNDNSAEKESEVEDTVPTQLSTFEAKQERLKSRIKALETAALKEKPWQLKGEVTANSRPQNSLLEEYVEFDIATRPAPVLTEKSTLKLEDIILQRIKDKAWDDVVRKIKPVEGGLEYQKQLVLDQEKSKLSLAQIYEQEYLNQLDKKNESVIEKPEVEAPQHKEIRIMMNKLFAKLDALSNFHFTPKHVKEEVKIISNIPAINIEEVAPVATSDAALLAPEEIKPKSKGEIIGKSERSATDKKRERRRKKIKQKLKFKKIAARENEKLEKNSSKGHNKNISQKLLEKITKTSNVIQLDQNQGGKYVKSSNAFFSKLQDETNSFGKKAFELKKPKFGRKLKSVNSKKI